MKDKFKNVLPWTKHDKPDISITQPIQVYSGVIDSDHIYDQIPADYYDNPEPDNRRLDQPLPLPKSATVSTSTPGTSCKSNSSASLPNSFKTSGTCVSNPLPNDLYGHPYEALIGARELNPSSVSEYANPYEWSDSRDSKSPYYSQPPDETNVHNTPSSTRQCYDVPRRVIPISNIGTSDVTSSYYLEPTVESTENESSLNREKRYLTIIPNVSRSSDQTGVVKRPDFKKCIPQDITKCNSVDVDSDEWDKLCLEYAEYSSDRDVNDNYEIKNIGTSSRPYMTMRPSVKHKSRTSEKPKILTNVSVLKCPNICDDAWDALCDEYAN